MRPEGCVNPITEEYLKGCAYEMRDVGYGEGWEDGADAMLEGLKRKGVYRESAWPFDAPRQKTNGHWVFIPEEIDGKD